MIKKANYNVSKSQDYLDSKNKVPLATAYMAKEVSAFRKESIAGEVTQGLFKDGSSVQNNNSGLTYHSNVTASFKKEAQLVSNIGANFQSGVGNVVQQMPEVYSPLWLNSNISLPRDRATINAWCRSFYALNPFVRNAINLHSTYPISKLNIKCANKEIEKFFNDMIEEIDLMNICVQIAQEYWLLGEAFVYAELNESQGKWSRLMLHNPDYMTVQRSIVASEPIITLRPDQNLIRIVSSNKSSDIEQRKQLNPHIIESVKKGNNISLDSFNVSHLANRISPYEIRGTGLPVCIFRQLALFDQLRESKFVQAAGMINPISILKVGTDSQEGQHPTHADLEQWRDMMEQAMHNKNFTIITHAGVTLERVGWNSGIIDISPDITQLIKEIYIGLQVPSALMDGGADTTYANASVSLDVLKQRYMQFRNMLSHWLKRKIFAPISKINNFYDYKDGNKQLIIPDIDWNYMNLFETGDNIQQLVALCAGDETTKRASVHTLYRSLGLEYKDEQLKIRREAIQSAIALKEKMALSSMGLNELRALEDDSEILEVENVAGASGASGTSPENPVPGEMGMPSLDLSAPPVMPETSMPTSPIK